MVPAVLNISNWFCAHSILFHLACLTDSSCWTFVLSLSFMPIFSFHSVQNGKEESTHQINWQWVAELGTWNLVRVCTEYRIFQELKMVTSNEEVYAKISAVVSIIWIIFLDCGNTHNIGPQGPFNYLKRCSWNKNLWTKVVLVLKSTLSPSGFQDEAMARKRSFLPWIK